MALLFSFSSDRLALIFSAAEKMPTRSWKPWSMRGSLVIKKFCSGLMFVSTLKVWWWPSWTRAFKRICPVRLCLKAFRLNLPSISSSIPTVYLLYSSSNRRSYLINFLVTNCKHNSGYRNSNLSATYYLVFGQGSLLSRGCSWHGWGLGAIGVEVHVCRLLTRSTLLSLDPRCGCLRFALLSPSVVDQKVELGLPCPRESARNTDVQGIAYDD